MYSFELHFTITTKYNTISLWEVQSMDVHEDFRNCLIAELMLKLNGDTHAVQNIVSVFDFLLNDFDIHRKGPPHELGWHFSFHRKFLRNIL